MLTAVSYSTISTQAKAQSKTSDVSSNKTCDKRCGKVDWTVAHRNCIKADAAIV
jgi:hypothetical protein